MTARLQLRKTLRVQKALEALRGQCLAFHFSLVEIPAKEGESYGIGRRYVDGDATEKEARRDQVVQVRAGALPDKKNLPFSRVEFAAEDRIDPVFSNELYRYQKALEEQVHLLSEREQEQPTDQGAEEITQRMEENQREIEERKSRLISRLILHYQGKLSTSDHSFTYYTRELTAEELANEETETIRQAHAWPGKMGFFSKGPQGEKALHLEYAFHPSEGSNRNPGNPDPSDEINIIQALELKANPGTNYILEEVGDLPLLLAEETEGEVCELAKPLFTKTELDACMTALEQQDLPENGVWIYRYLLKEEKAQQIPEAMEVIDESQQVICDFVCEGDGPYSTFSGPYLFPSAEAAEEFWSSQDYPTEIPRSPYLPIPLDYLNRMQEKPPRSPGEGEPPPPPLTDLPQRKSPGDPCPQPPARKSKKDPVPNTGAHRV